MYCQGRHRALHSVPLRPVVCVIPGLYVRLIQTSTPASGFPLATHDACDHRAVPSPAVRSMPVVVTPPVTVTGWAWSGDEMMSSPADRGFRSGSDTTERRRRCGRPWRQPVSV